MSRVLDVYKFVPDASAQGGVRKEWLSYWIAQATGYKFQDQRGKPDGIKVDGCGTDTGFEVVYTLGRVLFPEGFAVNGRGRNGDTSGWDTDGGYALKQEWI